MKVLVTGANGMVARALIVHSDMQSDTVAAFPREQLDISDRGRVYRAFEMQSPDIVFNCAAFTDVDSAETDGAAAYAANTSGPEYLAAASRDFGATFLTISTDYVFDGMKGGFYTENDQPNPQSVYARSKYEGELRCIATNTNSIIVRTGWVFGKGGTNFLSRVPQLLKSGSPLKAIDDSFGTPTFADDLASRLRELAVTKQSGIFHVANSGSGASYFEFAVEAAKVMGIETSEIGRISDLELNRPAARPRNSRLRSLKNETMGFEPLREWKAALAAFVVDR